MYYGSWCSKYRNPYKRVKILNVIVVSSHYFPEVTACSFRVDSIVKQLVKVDSVNVKLVNAMYDKNPNVEKKNKFDHYVISNTGGKRTNFMLRFFDELKIAVKCAKLSKSLKPDLIFVTTPYMAFIFVFLFFCLGKRGPQVHLDVRDLVWKYHDPTSGYIKIITFRVLGVLIEWSIKFYDSVSVTNELQREYLNKKIQKEIKILPNGINCQQADKMRRVEKRIYEPDIIKICYIGNIGYAQDMVPLIELSRLHNVHIDLYGTGAQVPKLNQEFASKNLTNIMIHGNVKNDEVSEIYSASDFVFVGIKDYINTAVPSKVYECAMSGKPILFSGGSTLKKYLKKFDNFFDVREVLTNNLLTTEENLRGCLDVMRNLDVAEIRDAIVKNYSREKNSALFVHEMLQGFKCND